MNHVMDDAQRKTFMDEKQRLKQIAIVFIVYLVLAAFLPAADDEVYYWCWSKDLQWSYYDHPPMTAVLIRLATAVLGDSIFAFRVPACIASAFALYVISRLTCSRPLIWGVLLTPVFTFLAVLMTPDSPLLMCWAAYLWWLVELHQRMTLSTDGLPENPPSAHLRWWLIGGLILGCGILSKYTMGLAVPVAFVSLLLTRQPWQHWLKGYIVHGVVAFVVASPILIYNVQQNFEPLLFQWRHSAQKTPNALISIVEFIGIQILAFGTLPFYLFPWVVSRFTRLSQNPKLRVCACLYALPLAFFLYKSTQTRLEGNWALVCFVSFWPLAAVWYESVRESKFWRRSTASAFLPPFIAVILVFIHLIWPFSFVPIKPDRFHRAFALNSATREVARLIRERGDSLPVYTDSYQMTAWLRFQKLPAQQIDGLTRPSHFTRPPRRLTDVDRAYVVTNRQLPYEFADGFGPPVLLASVPIEVRGTPDGVLNVRLYTKQKANDRDSVENGKVDQ